MPDLTAIFLRAAGDAAALADGHYIGVDQGGDLKKATLATAKTYFQTGLGSIYQPLDATLTALAGLNATAGLVEQTGADAFTKRLIGVTNATDIPTRADADTRYAATAHNHSGVYQPINADLSAIAALTPANDDILQCKAGAWTNRTIAQYKTDLSLSGTNTGDQTSVTGNAGTATALQTARNINGVAFDGTADITVTVPAATGISGLGTGVATALAVNVGSAGAPVLFDGALGTPTSGVVSTGVTLGGVTMTLGSDADGDIYYRASNVLTRLAKGTAGQVLTMNGGATAPEWAAAGGGGLTVGTTAIASGTATRLLYETAGNVLGQDSGLTYDSTNKALSIGGATVTASSPVLNLSQTWNNGAVAFTGLDFNITATASNSASIIADFRIGGSSVIKLTRAGEVSITDPGFSSYSFRTSATNAFRADSSGFALTSAKVNLKNSSVIGWSSTGNWFDTADLGLARSAAGALRITNASTGAGSLVIGTSTVGSIGTSGVGVLAIANGTAPSSSPADEFQFYSADWNGAGTAAAHFRNEEGHIVKICSQAVAALTNNVTSGGTDDQITDWTDLTVYATDAAAIRNAIYQLSRKLAEVVTAQRANGLFR